MPSLFVVASRKRRFLTAAGFACGAVLLVGQLTEAPAAEQQPAPDTLAEGRGWTMTTLDLDVYVEPASARLRIAGDATLRLDAEQSAGPILRINADHAPALSYEEMSAGPRVEVALNEAHPTERGVRLARLTRATPFERGDTVHITYVVLSSGHAFKLAVGERAAVAAGSASWYPQPLAERAAQRLGDSRFFTTLRVILQKYAGRTLTVEELRAEILQAGNDAELAELLHVWLDETGLTEEQRTFLMDR